MKQFFKFLFASCLGTFIALFLIFGLFLGSAIGAIGDTESQKPIYSNSVLHLKLDDRIPELTDNVEVSSFDIKTTEVLGLRDMVRSIEAAKDDEDIKGIFLEADIVSSGFTTIRVLRETLVSFKESGKFIIGHAPYYSQGAFYLATTADELSVEPLGVIDLRGVSAQIPFYKEMLDKLGLEMQVFFAGKYKSATEPYRRKDMSPESREQTRVFLNEIYDLMVSDISSARNLSEQEVRRLIDNFSGHDVDEAKANGLVDETIYREAVLEKLRIRLGLESDAKINFVSAGDYFSSRVGKENAFGDRVAVLMAEGTIVDGLGEAGSIGDDRYIKLIDKIRQNENIKAVVLRVNSPGGSAMASDRIWKALIKLKDSGKPLVISMGDYAASGGYYIACMGDQIFAEPSTLTGSIGVFSMIPNAQELLNDKLGINFDTVQTGAFSAAFTTYRKWSPAEQKILQKSTDRMYSTFLSRVAEGRGIDSTEVHKIAQGRVWTGDDAKDIGLVDQLGGTAAAIADAAQRAGLGDDYTTEIFPKPISPWQRLVEKWVNKDDIIAKQALQKQLGEFYPMYQYLEEINQTNGVQMRMPYLLEF